MPYQFSDFGAQAYYRQGFQGGYTHGMGIGSTKGYQSGHHVGLAEGFQAGIPQGMQTGFQKGYSDSTPRGYYNGFQHGYVQGMPFGAKKGEKEGFPFGEKLGYKAGYSKGGNEGFQYGEKVAEPVGRSVGYHKGYPSGHHAGYHDGYLKGFHSGEMHGSSMGHQQGFLAGRQEGLHSGYMTGFQQGLMEGQKGVQPFAHAVAGVAQAPTVGLPQQMQQFPSADAVLANASPQTVKWGPLDHTTLAPIAPTAEGMHGSANAFAVTQGATGSTDKPQVIGANLAAPFYEYGGNPKPLASTLPPSAQPFVDKAQPAVTMEKEFAPNKQIDGPSITGPKAPETPAVPERHAAITGSQTT